MDTAITLFEQINNARAKANLPVLGQYEPALEQGGWAHINSAELVISDEDEGRAEGVDVDDFLIAQIEKVVTADASDEKQRTLFDAMGTHMQVSVSSSADSSSFSCQVLVFFRYLGLDPLGPLIDGSLAISGAALHEDYSVSFCVVQHADQDTPADFKVISSLAPSSMIITRPSAADAAEGTFAKFTIPIAVPPEYSTGTLNISLYADKLSEIPEEGSPQAEDWEAKLATTYATTSMCAVQFSTSAAGADGGIAVGDLGDAIGQEFLGDGEEKKLEGDEEADEEEEEEEEVDDDGEEGEEGAEKRPKKMKKKSKKAVAIITPNEETPTAPATEAEVLNTNTTESALSLEEEEPMRLLENVKVATDYEEQMLLHRDGYELSCITITREVNIIL
jgi:hypothetical protein